MSKEKTELTLKQKAEAIVAKWKKKINVVALLTLTTSTGDPIEFKDLEPTAAPKEGDFATINGEIPPSEVIIVDGDKKVKYSFDEKGAVTKIEEQADSTEDDSAEMQALKEENATLKEQLTALQSQADATQVDITAMISEFEGVARLIGSGKNVTAVGAYPRKDKDDDDEPENQSAKVMVALTELRKRKGRA